MIARLFAMEKERDMFLLHNEDNWNGFLSGIGKVNAAITLTQIYEENRKVDGVIAIGVAGSLKESLNVGDIVCFRKFAYHDVYCGDGQPRGQVQGNPLYYDFTEYETDKAVLLSGDSFIEGDTIREFDDAWAVDMESAAIAQTCYRLGIQRFVSVRVISDKIVGKSDISYKDFWEKGYAEKSFSAVVDIVKGIEESWKK